MLFEQQIRVGPRNHVWRPDPQRKDVLRGTGHAPDNVMGLLQLRFEHDSSTIRARFEHDTSTARYNTLRGFSCARIRDRFEHSTRISGRRVLHVD